VTGHQWLNYHTTYPSLDGATSLLIDPDGHLLATIASYSAPSLLLEFGVAADGTYDGTATEVLSDTDRLGELRLHDGRVYVSSGNGIFEVVPEPGTFALLGVAAAAIAFSRRRSRSGDRAKRAWVEHSSRVLCRASRPAPEPRQDIDLSLNAARTRGDSAGRRAQHAGRVLHPRLPAAAPKSLREPPSTSEAATVPRALGQLVTPSLPHLVISKKPPAARITPRQATLSKNQEATAIHPDTGVIRPLIRH
jgi:hypothetical protein